jgi:hypothetical protein
VNAFRFPLEKALEWRRKQLELEEVRYRQQASAIALLDRQRAETEAAGIRAELEMRQRASVEGHELAALDHFRLRVKTDEARIGQQRVEAARILVERQTSMMEARRRAKLLEHLRERRLEEWEGQRAQELEELASESFLAQWNRRSEPG